MHRDSFFISSLFFPILYKIDIISRVMIWHFIRFNFLISKSLLCNNVLKLKQLSFLLLWSFSIKRTDQWIWDRYVDADNRLAVRREFIEILDVGQEQIPAVVASRFRHFVLLLIVLRNSTRPHPKTNIERFSNTFDLRIVTSSSPLIVHAIFTDDWQYSAVVSFFLLLSGFTQLGKFWRKWSDGYWLRD